MLGSQDWHSAMLNELIWPADANDWCRDVSVGEVFDHRGAKAVGEDMIKS
jgi:hypothetical protein